MILIKILKLTSLAIYLKGNIHGFFFNFEFLKKNSFEIFLKSRLPEPQIPNISFWPEMIKDAFVIGLVAFSINASLGALFARKHKYKIDYTQVFIFNNQYQKKVLFKFSDIYIF